MRDTLLVISILGCCVLGMALKIHEDERVHIRMERDRLKQELAASREALDKQKAEFVRAQELFQARTVELEQARGQAERAGDDIAAIVRNVEIRVPVEIINKQISAGNASSVSNTDTGLKVTLKNGLRLFAEKPRSADEEISGRAERLRETTRVLPGGEGFGDNRVLLDTF